MGEAELCRAWSTPGLSNRVPPPPHEVLEVVPGSKAYLGPKHLLFRGVRPCNEGVITYYFVGFGDTGRISGGPADSMWHLRANAHWYSSLTKPGNQRAANTSMKK